MAIVNQQTQNVNTPTISSSATALVANPARTSWMIQNLGTNPLYILKGLSASTTVFHVVLKAGSVNDDGTGGSFAEEAGTIYIGAVTVAGTSPRYVITEHAA